MSEKILKKKKYQKKYSMVTASFVQGPDKKVVEYQKHSWKLLGLWTEACCQKYEKRVTWNCFSAQTRVPWSQCSPATNKYFRHFVSYLWPSIVFGSTIFMARSAVGATKNPFTLCSLMILEKRKKYILLLKNVFKNSPKLQRLLESWGTTFLPD